MRPKLAREEWESEIFKINCYKLDRLLASFKKQPPVVLSKKILSIEKDLSEAVKPLLISARIPENDKPMKKALELSGYRLVEKYHVYKKPLKAYNTIKNRHEVRLFKPCDLKQLKKIAGTSFIYDRFHREKHIDKRLADRSREIWLENSCRDRNQFVLVATLGKEAAGFNAVKKGRGCNTISLIAVKKSARGKGLGEALVLAAANYSLALGAEELAVGSQADNIPGVALYRKCGFRRADKKLTFHKVLLKY